MYEVNFCDSKSDNSPVGLWIIMDTGNDFMVSPFENLVANKFEELARCE
ncbi:MAG: hypothetical protein JEZ08_08215 [Clostridiales bacterium]|nr:hypothetical protein [Clostridiales bacterium]